MSRFNPLSDEQINEMRPQLQPGRYKFLIAKAEDRVSKSGNDMTKVTLHVLDNKGCTHIIFDYIVYTAAMMWKVKHLCESIGILDKYERGEVSAHDLDGRSGIAQFGFKKNSETQAMEIKVADYIKDENKPFDDAISFGNEVPKKDDIPF